MKQWLAGRAPRLLLDSRADFGHFWEDGRYLEGALSWLESDRSLKLEGFWPGLGGAGGRIDFEIHAAGQHWESFETGAALRSIDWRV